MQSVTKCGTVLALLILVSKSASGQIPSLPGDVMLERYLAHETMRVSAKFLDGAQSRAEWEARRPRLKQEFLEMIGLSPLPEKTPLHATVTGTLEREQFVIEKLHYQSRPGLYVTANLYRPKRIDRRLPAVLFLVGHYDRGRNGHKTFRGVGPTVWTKTPPNFIERAHAVLGRTVDQGRVWDIAATARWLDAGRGIKVIGRGQSGVLAAYAAIFEPSITEVMAIEPPVTHRDGPIFLNVLGVLDVPAAFGLLAPRPLTLVGANDNAFDLTRDIYTAAGATAKLRRD